MSLGSFTFITCKQDQKGKQLACSFSLDKNNCFLFPFLGNVLNYEKFFKGLFTRPCEETVWNL